MGIGPSHFMKDDPPLDEKRVRFIWEQAVMPYIEEQSFGDENRLKEFAYDRVEGRGRPRRATWGRCRQCVGLS